MPTTLARLRRLTLLRRIAIPLMAIESMAVLFEQTTGLDPLPNVVDVILTLGGLCALAMVSVAEALAGGLSRRIAADARDLAIRRQDEEQQLQARRATRERVENIIEGAAYPAMVFQPIVELQTGHTLGYEALSRFGSESPEVWFAEATRAGLGEQLELKAISRALELLPDLPEDTFLSLNCSPATLVSAALDELLYKYPGGRLVIELTEQTTVDDYRPCRAAADRLRTRGVRLAIDDLGAGYSSLQRVIALQPEIIKLDRGLIQVTDPAGNAMVQTLVTLGQLTGATIIAEGIEDTSVLGLVRELGVPLGQGFHLGKPCPITELTDSSRAAARSTAG